MTETTNATRPTTLVLGGTGKTGRRVADRLTARGLPVRLGSRTGTPAFDWNDRSTWTDALHGVDAAYISYYPDVAVPGAADTIAAFAEQAVRAGVRRLVLLSGRGEPGSERAEQAVIDSGADWTIVRSSWFSQNFSESFFLDFVVGGALAVPGGSVAEPFTDVDDIADVAVAALAEDGHSGQAYELTGPRLLTFDDVAGELSAATGRDIRYVPVTPEQFAAAMAEAQVPGEYIDLLSYLFTEVLDGRNATLGDGVQRALGRAPRDFTDYVREAAASGVWNA